MNEQISALQTRFDKLGFPRSDEFHTHIANLTDQAIKTGQPQTFVHNREASTSEITIAPGKTEPTKVYLNSIVITGLDKDKNPKETLRFPTGGTTPTITAMENAANGHWVLLKNYQPKDTTQEKNDVWMRVKEGKKEFVSTKDFSIKLTNENGKPVEILGHVLTEQNKADLEKGKPVFINDAKMYEKGSNVPIGNNPNTVVLYVDAASKRIGYNQLDKRLELQDFSKKNENEKEMSTAVKNAVEASKTEEKKTKKVNGAKVH